MDLPQDQPPTPEHPQGLTTRYDGRGRELTDRARDVHAVDDADRVRRAADLNLMSGIGDPTL